MTWRDIIDEFPSVLTRRPAEPHVLERLEQLLGLALPGELNALLLESDGLLDEYGTDVVWSAERILSDNLAFRNDEEYRSLYLPFDYLIFFGDNGGGDQFAFTCRPPREEVFVWDHETDERNAVSPTLASFVRSALASDGEDWYR
ncbi:SMI1/KNR4 family protein [Streptomyces mutabilis]|uniref:SMI1/KNR4 family protein n=1 Tax=Streptomyces mutabilis TaxID=67332 RepID=UPI000A256FEA|nr:SMI1/KNR4 family protein [Streptomyces sp. Alain-F2R5]MDG9691184.1 SMI1/KNR4 family protein [Streptomyces sp. DH17]OSC72668.1 SMI1/KNR4 family protein [Streptomyces sp. 4F]PAN02553.1 SMI1/KNR4 family protein [Streptomyces sp. Alain-F2R5]